MKELFISEINKNLLEGSIKRKKNDEIENLITQWKEQLTVKGYDFFTKKIEIENLTLENFREILYLILQTNNINPRLSNRKYSLPEKKELGYLILFGEEILPVFSEISNKIEEYNKYFSINKAVLLKSCKEYILSTITKISENTIFHEFKTWEERYGNGLDSFSKNLENSHFKYYFIKKYTLLHRLIKDEIKKAYDYIIQILESLKSDLSEIRKIIDFKTLKKIEFGLGDRHNLGKTVTLIIFNNNLKIIYKPYSLSTNQSYNEFVRFYINKKKILKYEINNPKIINKNKYGWQEFIIHQTTDNKKNLKEYYYKVGVHLFLYYVLNGNDLHFENTICNSNTPMIIDMETLLSPQTNTNMKIDLKNVLQVGLLPFSVFTGQNYFEIGGLTDPENIKSPFKRKTINLLEGKIVEEDQFFKQSKNIPYGKKINLLHYIDNITDGFTDAYSIILKDKNEIFDIIKFYFSDTKIRYIARDTMIYSHLLRESYHPFLLTYGFLLEKHFDWLWLQTFENSKLDSIILSEKNSLLNFDVPYFYTTFKSKNLYDLNGLLKKDFFDISPIDSIKENINNINIEDKERQIWIIKASIISYINNQS